MSFARKVALALINSRFFLFVFYCFSYVLGYACGVLLRILGVDRSLYEDGIDRETEEYLSRLKDNASNN